MIRYNIIRYGTDVFGQETDSGELVLTKSAMLSSKVPLDCTGVSAVDAFKIEGTEPADSKRRFLFKIEDKLYKFTGSALEPYTGNGDVDDVLENGNTAAELLALSNITQFVGKEIYPVIALECRVEGDAPTVKLSLNTRVANDTLSKTIDSAKYSLTGNNCKILDINADSVLTGEATCEMFCRLYHNDAWGNWIRFNEAQNQPAEQIQFRFKFKVVNIGSDSAQVNSITLRHTTGGGSVNGNITELFSTVQDFEVPLDFAYLIVRHARLIDSTIDAYINFLPAPKHRERVDIGVSTGTRQSYALADNQIDQSSFQIYVDGALTDDFDYNCEVNEITLTAPNGSAISASYDFDCGEEDWQLMPRDGDQQPYGDDTYMSRFSFNGYVEDTMSKANIRIVLTKTSGSTDSIVLTPAASGKLQQWVLPHKFDKLIVSKGVQWSYDADNQILSTTAPAGTRVAYKGSWTGEQHKLFGWVAGFATGFEEG